MLSCDDKGPFCNVMKLVVVLGPDKETAETFSQSSLKTLKWLLIIIIHLTYFLYKSLFWTFPADYSNITFFL